MTIWLVQAQATMESFFMSKPIFMLVIVKMMLASLLLAQPKSFEAPDGKTAIMVEKAFRLGSDWEDKGFSEYLSLSLRRNNNPLAIWLGVTYVDESGSQPNVMWSKSSKTALLSFRPQRGEVIIAILRPDAVQPFENILTGDRMKKWTENLTSNETGFVKAWLESWIGTDADQYEGILVITKGKTNRIRLRIDANETPSKVTVLSTN